MQNYQVNNRMQNAVQASDNTSETDIDIAAVVAPRPNV